MLNWVPTMCGRTSEKHVSINSLPSRLCCTVRTRTCTHTIISVNWLRHEGIDALAESTRLGRAIRQSATLHVASSVALGNASSKGVLLTLTQQHSRKRRYERFY